jgi:acyl-CoA synthetase (AMP-forming)/AMP-acid ligase II
MPRPWITLQKTNRFPEEKYVVEVRAFSPSITKVRLGYLRPVGRRWQEILDEKKTKEAIDAEGWVHTGDIGEIDDYGRFRIIDRIKVRMAHSTSREHYSTCG